MPAGKAAARHWRARIIDVLNREWDPIGVFAAGGSDEYDGYAGKLATMIRGGATDGKLSSYLNWAECQHMGLVRFDLERAEQVIRSLRAIGKPP